MPLLSLSLFICEMGMRILPTWQHHDEARERTRLCTGAAWRNGICSVSFIFSPSCWLLNPLGQSESQKEREGHLQVVNEDHVTKGLCVDLQRCGQGRRNTWDQQELEVMACTERQWRMCPPTPGENRGQNAGQGTLALTKGFGVLANLAHFLPSFPGF